jgi:hypothetical protein
MAKHCSDECKEMGSICDFCIHHNFDKSWCSYFNVEKEPYEGANCESFICFQLKNE